MNAAKWKGVLVAVGGVLSALAAVPGVIPADYLGWVTGLAGLLTGVAIRAPGQAKEGSEP